MLLKKFAPVFLAFSIVLLAADPFAGTWKLNSAKTKYKKGAPPKEQTITFTEEGSQVHAVAKGTTSDGQAFSVHFTAPSAGGSGKIVESTAWDGVSTKNIGANERETSFSKGGKVVYTARAKRSGDGKTMTVAVKGTNAAGQEVEGTAFYEKQ